MLAARGLKDVASSCWRILWGSLESNSNSDAALDGRSLRPQLVWRCNDSLEPGGWNIMKLHHDQTGLKNRLPCFGNVFPFSLLLVLFLSRSKGWFMVFPFCSGLCEPRLQKLNDVWSLESLDFEAKTGRNCQGPLHFVNRRIVAAWVARLLRHWKWWSYMGGFEWEHFVIR